MIRSTGPGAVAPGPDHSQSVLLTWRKDNMRGGTTTRDLAVDDTLRRVVVYFRILSWVWMSALVIVTLASDDNAQMVAVTISMIAATALTGATIWAARTDRLHRPGWVIGDGVVSLGLGLASTVAGAEDLFHGGMPMSWILVAAYAYGFRGSVVASILLAVEQLGVHLIDDRGPVGAAGSLVFVVFAVVAGQAFDALRTSEIRHADAERRLRDEQRATARHEERARLANRLHDSVLQTLLVIRRDAHDPDQVRYLARREERALRRSIADLRSEHELSFRAQLLDVCDDVEDTFRVHVESVIRDDTQTTPRLEAAIGAAREALVNAAKHSGTDHIDLYAETARNTLTINVRDRGCGFDERSRKTGAGFENSLLARVQEIGGSVTVVSAPGDGTEVTIVMDLSE